MLFIMLPNNSGRMLGQTHTGHNGLSTTLTGNTGKQGNYTKYSGSENRSFMRNKGHVFCVRTFMDSKTTLLGTCPEI